MIDKKCFSIIAMTFGREILSIDHEIFAWTSDFNKISWHSMDVVYHKSGMVPGVLTTLNGKVIHFIFQIDDQFEYFCRHGSFHK